MSLFLLYLALGFWRDLLKAHIERRRHEKRQRDFWAGHDRVELHQI